MSGAPVDRPWDGPPPWKGGSFISGGPPRDPARIEPILDELRKAWQNQPDQRLGQLLKNVLRGAGIEVPPTPVFNIEDYKLYDALRLEVRRSEAFACFLAAGLERWARGRRGKFLVTTDGLLHAWTINDTGSPHHQQVAERLGVESAVDGAIAENGDYWTTARNPNVDTAVLMREVRDEATAIGLVRADGRRHRGQ